MHKMTDLTAHMLDLQGDAFLVLSRAFFPPDAKTGLSALTLDFVADMRDILPALGHDLASLDRFEVSLTQRFTESPERLLVSYSRLFLAPPCRVSLNALAYLPEPVRPAALEVLLGMYRQASLEKAPGFFDMIDHLSVLLEFVARRYAHAAQHASDQQQVSAAFEEITALLAAFVLAWLPMAAANIERAASEAPEFEPWGHLAHLASQVAQGAYSGLMAHVCLPVTADPVLRADLVAIRNSLPKDREGQLAFMREKLRAAGLSAAHLGAMEHSLEGEMRLHAAKRGFGRGGRGAQIGLDEEACG
jgi:TorA maturation chaperone TorD